MSLLEKRRQYEAACSSKSLDGKPGNSKSSAVAERMRAKYGERKTPEKDVFPKRSLANITEQKVLKAGLRRLHKEIVLTKGVDILQLPRWPDGKCKVMQKPFFERLLSNRIEIKGSLESDVSAAQMDLRHLSVEQLLSLRTETMDFLTESEKFSAHNNFLNTLDQNLFEKITARCCEISTEKVPPGVKPQALYSTGLRIALTLGAADVFADADGNKSALNEDAQSPVALPNCWVIQFEDEHTWKGSRFAIFNVVDLTFKVVKDADFATAIPPEETLAVVRDRTSGAGPTRMMYWEVSILDPQAVGEDLDISQYIELRTRSMSSLSSRKLSEDLEQALRKVKSRDSSGWSPFTKEDSIEMSSPSEEVSPAKTEESPAPQNEAPFAVETPSPVRPVKELGSPTPAPQEETRRATSSQAEEAPLPVDTAAPVPVEEPRPTLEEETVPSSQAEEGNRRGPCSDAPDVDESTAEVADESEEGVALPAHKRALALHGNTTEGRSVKTPEVDENESRQMLVKPRQSCFAGCFAFAQRPAK